MARLQWDDVRYFLVLARHGSLSGASRTLRVEHSTVGRRVASLEASLGVRLFDRLPRGWRLTFEGSELLSTAQRIESEVLSLERAATSKEQIAGTVRISAPPVVVSHLLLPCLAPLRTRHPRIDLELSSDRREVNLIRGEAELALRVGHPDVPQGLVVRALGQIGYGLYGTKQQLLRPHVEQCFVGFDDSMRGVPQKQWLDEHAGQRRVVVRSSDFYALFCAAKEGLGIALLPHFLVGASDGLEHLATAGPALERPLSLVVHPDVRRSARVKAVIAFVVALTASKATWLRTPLRRPHLR